MVKSFSSFWMVATYHPGGAVSSLSLESLTLLLPFLFLDTVFRSDSEDEFVAYFGVCGIVLWTALRDMV